MTKKIRLKDKTTGDVLHPETEWELINNRPINTEITNDSVSIISPNKNLAIETDQTLSLNSNGKTTIAGSNVEIVSLNTDITIADKNTSGKTIPLKQYPLSQEALSLTNLSCFGIAWNPDNLGTTYPAVRIRHIYTTGTTYTYFYVNSSGYFVKPIAGVMKFRALNSSTTETM